MVQDLGVLFFLKIFAGC